MCERECVRKRVCVRDMVLLETRSAVRLHPQSDATRLGDNHPVNIIGKESGSETFLQLSLLHECFDIAYPDHAVQ